MMSESWQGPAVDGRVDWIATNEGCTGRLEVSMHGVAGQSREYRGHAMIDRAKRTIERHGVVSHAAIVGQEPRSRHE